MSQHLPPYITERLDNQISWYGKKAASNKLRFRICQLIVIVTSASIPIINLGVPWIDPGEPFLILGISAILGGIITVVTALSQMDSYFETWMLYRTTAEALKRERYLYMSNAADYSDLQETTKLKLLVERIEGMLSSENSKFISLQQHAKQQSEQQLNELVQQQHEINKQQREELLELRKFKKKYEQSKLIDEITREIELLRSSLTELKFPTNKQNIKSHIEQNRAKINDIDSVILTIEKLPPKEYLSIKEIENELLK